MIASKLWISALRNRPPDIPHIQDCREGEEVLFNRWRQSCAAVIANTRCTWLTVKPPPLLPTVYFSVGRFRRDVEAPEGRRIWVTRTPGEESSFDRWNLNTLGRRIPKVAYIASLSHRDWPINGEFTLPCRCLLEVNGKPQTVSIRKRVHKINVTYYTV